MSTPRHRPSFAALGNDTEAIEFLVEAGASIDARHGLGHTPLHNAGGNLNVKALRGPLTRVADVNPQSLGNQMALHLAARKSRGKGCAEVVDLLLRSGADEMIVDNNNKVAPDMVDQRHGYMTPLAEEEIERVRNMLANAPADRAWRRRGFMVLCRAHADSCWK